MALRREEADDFLVKVLAMPPAPTVVETDEDRTPLLDSIVRNFQQRIPYQSVTACATPPQERHLPSWAEIKADMFSGVGGLCYTLHVFMKELLSALDFDVSYVSASGYGPGDDHITIVASGVSGRGSRHLVEVGCGYPTFRAIPLDFETESPEYQSDFLLHKFVKRGDAIIWLHEYRVSVRKNSLIAFQPSKLVDDVWYQFLEIRIDKPRELKFFERIMTPLYTVKENNILLDTPRIVGFADGNLLAIVGNLKVVGDDETVLRKTTIGDKRELLALYSTHFPLIERALVENAIKFSNFTI